MSVKEGLIHHAAFSRENHAEDGGKRKEKRKEAAMGDGGRSLLRENVRKKKKKDKSRSRILSPNPWIHD